MENSLVSVVVITYNSSATVIETLDSIKNQTYPNIELIVTDDCSKDNTVDICREWLDSNSNRFVSTRLITIEKNTGTSANCNRGWRNSQGEWIKFIAGDDRLLPNCISDNIEFTNKNVKASIVFSKVIPIGDIEEGKKWPWLDGFSLFANFTPKQMRILLCFKNPLYAPSAFIKVDTLEKLEGYDETIHLIEDWPFWMKAVNSGYELAYMNKETVEYRFSVSSVSQGSYSDNYLQCINKCKLLGEYYFQQINVGTKIYYFTMSHRNDNFIMRILHIFNVFNPSYYKYINILKKFDNLKQEMSNLYTKKFFVAQ